MSSNPSTVFIRKLLACGVLVENGKDYEVSPVFVAKWRELSEETKLIHLQQTLKALVREGKFSCDLTEAEYHDASVFLSVFFEEDYNLVTNLQARVEELEKRLAVEMQKIKELEKKEMRDSKLVID